MNGSRAWFEKDFYKILGVPETAGAEDIKRAYRNLARTYHPDRNPGDAAAEEKFKEISEASDVLSDPKKRAEYDQMRKMAASGFRGFPGGGGGFGGGGPGGFGGGVEFDLGDILGSMFGGGGGRGRRAGPQRGGDLESEIVVSFRDAASGIEVPVRLDRDAPCSACRGTGDASGNPATCPACGGRGSIQENQGPFAFSRPCPTCGGNGRVVETPCAVCRGSGVKRRTEDVRVRIPAGVKDGSRVRVRGRGTAGRGGGPAGDLYVRVRVEPDRIFGRRDADLTLTAPVTYAEAALGAKITVPTLNGSPVTLKVPAGTPSGKTFRVKGRGLPRARGGSGDLLVTVQVDVPKKLSRAEKELLEQLAAERGESPRAHLEVTA